MSKSKMGLIIALAFLAVAAAIALPIVQRMTAPKMLDSAAAAKLANQGRLDIIPQEELDKLTKVVFHAPNMECAQCFLSVQQSLDSVEAIDIRHDEVTRDVHFYSSRSEQEIRDMLEEARKTNDMFADYEVKLIQPPKTRTDSESDSG